MAYVIAAPCIDHADQTCVSVCPVDCITADDPDYARAAVERLAAA